MKVGSVIGRVRRFSCVTARRFARLVLAGLLAVVVYAIGSTLLLLETVNGQPDSGGDVVAYMG